MNEEIDAVNEDSGLINDLRIENPIGAEKMINVMTTKINNIISALNIQKSQIENLIGRVEELENVG